DGTWSEQLDLSSLGDGTLTATAWQVDGVGNTGTTRTAEGLKDTVLPAAPSVGFSGPVTVERPTVTLSGTGETGDLLTVSVDDTDGATQPVTDTVSVADSLWTTSLDLSGLSDGTLTATVSQVDEVGNVSPDGQATGVKDATAPGMPAITTAGPVNAAGAASVPLAGTGTTGDTVKVLVSDDVHPALAATASVTDGAWATSLNLSGLDDGPLTISATDVDAVGNGSSPATLTFAKDTVAPHVALTAPRPAFMLGTVRAAWSGSDGGTGLATAPYDVRWARGAHAKSLGGYRSLLTAVAARSTVRSVSAGVTACFEVRAHDAVGNVSDWSGARCSTAALDDRAMSATARWTRARDAKLYHGSALVTTVKGQRVVLAASPLTRVALVATHCGRCGVVGVYVGKRLVKIVDLHAVHTRRHVVTILPAMSARTKSVTIRVLSSGKQVVVDGVGTSTR
ncbi:MAG TPA: hypothetical protein VFJ98_01925, partial [Mycobacteriales bacterium]|nr:hypothetical protein [Mycobacteriales bacterium]